MLASSSSAGRSITRRRPQHGQVARRESNGRSRLDKGRKAFDNLYWVGQSEFGAWALKTSAGIILIDALYDYSVALAVRQPGDPNPYVIGTEAVARYLTVAEECVKAAGLAAASR